MKSVQFIFALHDHQPVGNFGHVIESAYEKAYLPFLELLETYRGFRACLHHTGPLLEWIEANRPDYLRRLQKLVDSGQVELLGGAFYEPILPTIPEEDRVGQIELMSDWLETVFGVRPRGMWLAERVWEPTLPRAMHAAGIEYTVLDDSHFAMVGVKPGEALGYYLTEDLGNAVAVFPINQRLRQGIPYRQPEESLDYLREVATAEAVRTAIMADDGEKFGVWPDSHWYCYQEGWMYRFVEMVVNNEDWLCMRHFSEVLDTTAPLGRVYLPTASYLEMMEWALPPRALAEYREAVKDLREKGAYEDAAPYLRGGFWRSFQARYDESNHLQKRMLHVSAKLSRAPQSVKRQPQFVEARDHLWRSQCNCAYWHGVFGGVYLTNLRHALYEHLLTADKMIDELTRKGSDWVEFLAQDFDVDGSPELLVETPAHALMFKPHAGGCLIEHDIRSRAFNLLDTMTRKREVYHEELGRQKSEIRVSNGHMPAELAEDWYRRGSLIDHFLGGDVTPETFQTALYTELGWFANNPFELEWEETPAGARVAMRCESHVDLPVGPIPVSIDKVVHINAGQSASRIEYKVTNHSDVELATRFGIEFNINLLAGDAEDRYHEIDGVNLAPENRLVSMGTVKNVQRFALVDEWSRLRVEWDLSVPSEHWRLPIQSISNSEAGIERIYQSTVVMPVWNLRVAPGHAFNVTIGYSIVTDGANL